MGDVIGFILSALSGVVGNGIYNTLTSEEIEYRITSAYNSAEDIFCKEYKEKYGDGIKSFLSRQENIDYIIKCLQYDSYDYIAHTGFNNKSFDDTLPMANKEDINKFIEILKKQMYKDPDLGRLLSEREHIIEQKEMKSKIFEMMNYVKDNNEILNRTFNTGTINFDEILKIYDEEDIDKQEFELIVWLNKNKGHKEGIVLKAYIAYKRKKWKLAYDLYKYIVEEYAEEFELNNTIGLICERIGEYKNAENFYKAVLIKDPCNLNVLFNLGNLYAQKYKDYDKALKCLFLAYEIAPEDSEILNNIGLIYKENADYENAEKYFKLGIKYTKNNPLPLLNMGDLCMDVYADYKNAIKYFEKYLEFEKAEKDQIHNVLGLIYGSIIFKDKEKSKKHFKEAIKINPYLKEARINLDIMESNRGYFDCFNTLSNDRFIDLYKQGFRQ